MSTVFGGGLPIAVQAMNETQDVLCCRVWLTAAYVALLKESGIL